MSCISYIAIKKLFSYADHTVPHVHPLPCQQHTWTKFSPPSSFCHCSITCLHHLSQFGPRGSCVWGRGLGERAAVPRSPEPRAGEPPKGNASRADVAPSLALAGGTVTATVNLRLHPSFPSDALLSAGPWYSRGPRPRVLTGVSVRPGSPPCSAGSVL